MGFTSGLEVRMLWGAMAVVALTGTAFAPALASVEDDELQVEFIAKVVPYIEWPEGSFASDTAPIRIGLLGQNPFGGLLAKRLRDTTIKGRGVVVESVESTNALDGYHVVIVGETRKRALRSLARQLKGLTALTIARRSSFAEYGGVMGIEMYEGKVAFYVNDRSAQKANLKIKSRLLQLATKIY